MPRRVTQQTRSGSLAPCSQNGNVHQVQVRIAIVAIAERSNAVAKFFCVRRIFRIDQPLAGGCIPPAGNLVIFLAGLLPVPRRHIARSIGAVRRDTQHQCLVVCMCGLQRFVDQPPVVDAFFRFQKPPIDTKICNARLGKIFVLQSSRRLLILDRKSLGPFRPGIQRIAVETLKRHKSYSRIDQDIMNLDRLDNHRRLLRRHSGCQRQNHRYRGKFSKSHACSLSQSFASCCEHSRLSRDAIKLIPSL